MKTKQIQKNIPKGWEPKTINDICENLDNLRKPVTKSERDPGSIPYYGATGIVDYVKDFIFNEKLLLVGEDGADWSKFADSSYIIEGKSWVNNHAHVLRCKKANIYFVKEFLNYNNLGNYITGTTRGKLNKQALMSLKLIFPPINEQKKIAEILETVDKEIEKTDEIIEKTEKLKKGLMQKLFEKKNGWKEVSLKKVTEKIGDGLHGTPNYSFDSEFYFINGNNLSDRQINIYPETKRISEEEYLFHKKDLNKKSILLSINGTIGNIGFYNNEKVALGKSACYINCKKDIIKEFIAYQLESRRIVDYFTKSLTGTTIKNLSLTTIRQTPILKPSTEEQQKIAEILSAVDEKISFNKKLKEKLTQLKKGLMQDLLSGEVRVNI